MDGALRNGISAFRKKTPQGSQPLLPFEDTARQCPAATQNRLLPELLNCFA